MLNKAILILLFLFISCNADAQELRLTKNGTFKSIKLKLPRTVVISYHGDSIIPTLKGKAVEYKSLNYIGLALPTFIVIGALSIFNINGLVLLIPIAEFSPVAIYFYSRGNSGYDTKKEWSFY